ncbi:hypothetical protein QJQ45_026172, partial [Haematococcus lacustris]
MPLVCHEVARRHERKPCRPRKAQHKHAATQDTSISNSAAATSTAPIETSICGVMVSSAARAAARSNMPLLPPPPHLLPSPPSLTPPSSSSPSPLPRPGVHTLTLTLGGTTCQTHHSPGGATKRSSQEEQPGAAARSSSLERQPGVAARRHGQGKWLAKAKRPMPPTARRHSQEGGAAANKEAARSQQWHMEIT